MNSKINLSQLFRSLVALTLLGVYFAVFLLNNLPEFPLHDHDHHAHEICTPELELDSCHRKVFHNDKIEGCDHNGHIHPPKSTYSLIKAVFSPHIVLEDIQFDPATEISFEEPVFPESTPKYFLSYPSISLRGPPFNV